MHFKGLPWDFLRQYEGLPKEGAQGFYCFDFYLQRLLLSKMGVGDFSVLWGEEVSFDWFRDNILHATLFSDGGSYLVYDSERLGAEIKEAILEHQHWEGRTMMLCFSKKSDFFDKLSKVAGAKCSHIEAPRFWEGGRLLDFLCEQMRLPLGRDVKNYLLEATSHSVSDFVQVLKFLSLNAPEGGELSRGEVERLVESRELNPFHLAELLASKKFAEFYRELVEKRVDFDTYRSTFSFMQTHLLKLGDPSYTQKKSRLSQYDREILARSKDWSKDEVCLQLRRMGEWEICAKRRDPFLLVRLRCSLVSFL